MKFRAQLENGVTSAARSYRASLPLFPRRRAALFTSGRGVGGGFVGAGCQRASSR
ncbi:hypothetical protein [Bilophila sp.]|uniref:hypothetical protein n=1 Tax=Bilophila sp. TaxID=1929485 RepID=UPI00307712CA